jgi:hypothetical protein
MIAAEIQQHIGGYLLTITLMLLESSPLHEAAQAGHTKRAAL